MHEAARIPPIRFQFTDPDDIKAYGNPDNPEGWWVYDEAAITALPIARLAALEDALPIQLLSAMQGLRHETIIGMHTATWLAIHLARPEIAGPFAEYNPKVMLIYFEQVPDDEPVEEAADPLASEGSATSSPTESPTAATKSNRSSPSRRTPRRKP